MKDYDLNLLRALHALLESGSVTAAAERLHLSVPATSHALARIREVFGDPILVRAGRALVPTPRALELKEPVATLLQSARGLVARPDRLSLASLSREFVVRAPVGFVVVYSAALLHALQQGMPNVTLRLVAESDDPGALRDGRIDLDIGTFRQRDPEVQTAELSRQSLLVAVRPDLAPAGRLTLPRYLAMAHVAVAARPREGSPLDGALDALGKSRRIQLTVPSAHSALVAAARSPLAATVTAGIARAVAPGLGLEIHTLPIEVAVEPMVMAWHPRHTADVAHQCLRDGVQRVMAESKGILPALAPAPARARGARAARR